MYQTAAGFLLFAKIYFGTINVNYIRTTSVNDLSLLELCVLLSLLGVSILLFFFAGDFSLILDSINVTVPLNML
jgi:hypothetical protein